MIHRVHLDKREFEAFRRILLLAHEHAQTLGEDAWREFDADAVLIARGLCQAVPWPAEFTPDPPRRHEADLEPNHDHHRPQPPSH